MIADALAQLMRLMPPSRPAPELSFAELPARTVPATIPTRHGEVRAVVYLPAASSEPVPVYVNLHGGGFILRHPEQDDPLCRYLAATAGVAVVNVDYDVAPAHRFPEPIEEAYDAVCWAAGPGRDWDGSRLCVGGQSAGGALAAAVARLALELGGPDLALQVLLYPVLDLVTPARDKYVAVKVLHESFQNDIDFCRRFYAEALAASRLDHPNVTRVLDFGQEPDGSLYFAMEYLDGVELRAMMDREKVFSAQRLATIMMQVCAGLAHAHARGAMDL